MTAPNKEKIAAMEAAAAEAIRASAEKKASAIIAEAEKSAADIMSAAKSKAAQESRLVEIELASMALLANPPRRVEVPLARGLTIPRGGKWIVSYKLTVDPMSRLVLDATHPEWPTCHREGVEKAEKEAIAYRSGDILPIDSKEWGMVLGLL